MEKPAACNERFLVGHLAARFKSLSATDFSRVDLHCVCAYSDWPKKTTPWMKKINTQQLLEVIQPVVVLWPADRMSLSNVIGVALLEYYECVCKRAEYTHSSEGVHLFTSCAFECSKKSARRIVLMGGGKSYFACGGQYFMLCARRAAH